MVGNRPAKREVPATAPPCGAVAFLYDDESKVNSICDPACRDPWGNILDCAERIIPTLKVPELNPVAFSNVKSSLPDF